MKTLYESLLDNEEDIYNNTRTSIIDSMLKKIGFELGTDDKTAIVDISNMTNDPELSFGSLGGMKNIDKYFKKLIDSNIKFQPLDIVSIYNDSKYDPQYILDNLDCDFINVLSIATDKDIDLSKINIYGKVYMRLEKNDYNFISEIKPPKHEIVCAHFQNRVEQIPKDWKCEYMLLKYNVGDLPNIEWMTELINQNPLTQNFIFDSPQLDGCSIKYKIKSGKRIIEKIVKTPMMKIYRDISHKIKLLEGNVDKFIFERPNLRKTT